MIRSRALAALFAAATVATAACDDDDDPVEVEPGNIVEVAREAGNFTTLIAALDAAGLTSALEGDGPFTVFAPTDEAFGKVPDLTLQALLQDADALTQVLTYHVVSGRVLAAEVITLGSAETLNGASVDITVNGSTVMIDDAVVTQTDIEASNGVIHVIDSVLLPSN